ncbi:MAG: pilus assembly protein [Chloroflexi bacterium]|nr:pilus assembly protein [Chloroflexota bacterium]
MMSKRHRGQALVELTLTLPIIALLLGGLVEVGIFINRYLTLIDLTREAARFASNRDSFSTPGDSDCSTSGDLNFYYDTTCIFSSPGPPPACSGWPDTFCNGFNPDLPLKPSQDDIVITVFSVNNNTVTKAWPDPSGYWALSGASNNWQYDCQGNIVTTQPFFSSADVNSFLPPNAPPDKAFVIVEAYYCYYQVLHLPIFYQVIPNPLKIHVYTVMPTVQPPRCMDTIDNDGDGFIDMADPQCVSPTDNDEAN